MGQSWRRAWQHCLTGGFHFGNMHERHKIAGDVTEKLNSKSKQASTATETFSHSQTCKSKSAWQQMPQQQKSDEVKPTGYK